MNMHRLSTNLVIGLCLVQVFACQKKIEKATEDSLEFSTSSDAALVSEFADCKLRTVTHTSDMMPDMPGWEIKGTFVYHADGRPSQLTYSESFGYDPNYYFIYDSQNRLKELLVGHSRTQGSDMSVWHKYGYNSANQIITDTLFNFSGTELSSAHPRFISTLTYDAQGRVKTEISTSGTSVTYDYDSKGNLQVAGWSSSYDNNISIYRMHPLFQFIHRNYSKNNAAPQAKYNVKGLPLSNAPSNDNFFSAYPTSGGGTGVVKATYDCDGFVPANEFLYCKLRSVTHESLSPPGMPNVEVKGTFIYHPDGLPAELTYVNARGLPNYYFVYDDKRRLKELQETYSRNAAGPVVWHRYGYNNFNQIVVDTLLNFTSFEPSSAHTRVIAVFTYDAQGRVKTEVRTGYSGGSPSGTQTITYNYDSRGNLIVAGWPSSSYDNKVSIFRAHSLFQFIHRNYSKNNAAPQAKYNSKGLPLSNIPMNHNFFNAYPNSPGETEITKINYDCP